MKPILSNIIRTTFLFSCNSYCLVKDILLSCIGHPKTLDEFTYSDVDISDILFKCMGNQSIVGLTHNISFRNGDDPEMNAQLERVQGIYFPEYKYILNGFERYVFWLIFRCLDVLNIVPLPV